jgi:RNA polymerase sigma-70 factor (ECF subfamily)
MASEQTLLRRARDLDMQALAEIYDLFSPALYRYAMRLLNDAPLAEDCVTETFSRLLSALNGDTGPREYLKAWLYRVAHNWITDHYRANGASGIVTVPLGEVDGDDDPIADPAPGPLDETMNALADERVRAALLALTPDQRQVVVLKYYEDMSNEEVAAVVGKPVSAVKSLQHRALASLRRLLIAYESPIEREH